jgi:hypothetical protein
MVSMGVNRVHRSGALAAALGLRPATVQQYARNGRIPFDTTPGGHRLFDIEEVRSALALNSGRPVAPPVRSRGTRGWLADAVELEAWSDRITARQELPELARVLVAGSCGDLRTVEFRGQEGTGMPGWDGIVDAVQGNSWVPEGMSAWEMGVDEDVTSKADADYSERTADPLGLVKSETTFVFVTPRRWPNRDSWATAKRAEGDWKDVRAYDADSLELWLDQTPAAHARVTAMLGRKPDGAADLESAWNDWAAKTVPPLPASLVTAGRSKEVEKVLVWLHGEPSSVSVAGDSMEEAFAFVAVALLGLPEEERTALLSRVLVVRTPAAWDEVLARAGTDSKLVLIPVFEGPEPAEATASGHHVAVPAGNNAVTVGTVITLPQLRTEAARAALEAAGFTEQQAGELARVARRSLLMLRRRLAASGGLRPQWAQPANGGDLVPVVLAGAWRDDNEADQEILSRLASREYAEISSLCTRWAAEEDMPVRRQGPVWSCVSKPDAWDLLSRMATSGQLTRFREIAVEVLGTADPALTLEPSRRWAAGMFGPALPWSAHLRMSIAETVAVIATQGAGQDLPGGGTGQDLADRIVREALDAANADQSGHLWSSLSAVLPTLAEASPGYFLDAVDAGLASGGLRAVFDPEAEKSLFASPTHTGLLWGLEALAWSPDYLGSAALALARLAEIDPGGRYANRPDRSLTQIFLPWSPQTTATRDEQLMVIDMIRHAGLAMSWSFMTSLLPVPHAVSDFSYKPRWRDWQAEAGQVSAAEWDWHAAEMTGRLLDDAGQDGQRWADLTARLPYLPLAQHNEIVARLDALDPAELADRAAVADALRRIVRDHRRFPDAAWAMPADLVDRIAEQLTRFEDTSSVPAAAWLFASHVELPGPWPKDIAAEQQEVLRLQETAVTDLVSSDGPSAFWELAEHCESPYKLGWAAGHAAADLADDIMTAELDSDGQVRRQAARGWVEGRFAAEGWPWATPLLQAAGTWTAPRTARFLLALPQDSHAFDWAGQLGEEVRELYWKDLAPLWIRDSADRERAARTLVELGQETSALDVLAVMVQGDDQPDTALVARALGEAVPDSDPTGNALTMYVHNVIVLLDYLEGRPETDRHGLAIIEWRYLPLLESRERPARILHQEMARDPEFFADVIEMVFQPENSPQPRNVTQDDRTRATLAYQLLRSWRTVPGTLGAAGIHDGPGLAQWVTDARAQLTQRRLLRPGDRVIGQILSQAPEDPDGTWPGQAVREILEDARSQHIEEGIDSAVFVGRGDRWRGTGTGGQTERALADKYQGYAQRTGSRWPRTRRMLQRMAANWDSRARQEDQLAAIREDFWS